MSVQSNINQMISLAGLLASQNPALKAAAEKRTAMKVLAKKEEVLTKAVDIAGQAGATKEAYDYQKELTDVERQKFDIDPTAESFEAYREAKAATPEGEKERADIADPDPEDIAKERYEAEKKESEVQDYLKKFREADESRAKAQAIKSETRKRILQGTPSEYLLKGDE